MTIIVDVIEAYSGVVGELYLIEPGSLGIRLDLLNGIAAEFGLLNNT